MTTNKFIPKNEQELIYLFSRHHEKLGFEKPISIRTQFPDAVFIRDGSPISIEFEFLLSRFLNHYKVRRANAQGFYEWDKTTRMYRYYNFKDKKFHVLSSGLRSHVLYVTKKSPTEQITTDDLLKLRQYEIERALKGYKTRDGRLGHPVFIKVRGTWVPCSDEIIIDYNNILTLEDHTLYWKSLKNFVDVVVCWEVDCELDDPGIEVIELKTLLDQIPTS